MPSTFKFVFKNKNIFCYVPNKCPICHRSITLNPPLNFNATTDEVQALFICPDDRCQNFFLGYYVLNTNGEMSLKNLKPSKVEIEVFPDFVSEISSSFLKIFYQAAEAKEMELDQIAGAGYRKAFEYLIKDYAIFKSPDKAEEIKKLFAGEVVNKFISDPRIQQVARRALWIGNDEVHYYRTWEDLNINDLIVLIHLTINWMETEHLSEKYKTVIPDKSKAE